MTAGRTGNRLPLTLAILAVLAGIISWLGTGPVRAVLGLWELGQSANPYWLPEHAMQLYIVAPLATLALSAFCLAPGLFLAAAFGQTKSLALWLLSGFGGALGAITLTSIIADRVAGAPLVGTDFLLLLAGTNLACLLVLAVRLAQGHLPKVSLAGQGADLTFALGLFWLSLVLMAPKFYWENFSGDGSGALQFARNFIHTSWPFWQADAGVIKQAPGLTSMLFVLPESWFVRVLGEWEFSVRAPLLLGLALLYPVLTALIRHGRPNAVLRLTDHLLLVAALVLYAFANVYSGGYHAWFGDSPMPAARETLAMVCFMGYILAFLEDRRALMLLTGVLAHLSIPTGGLWLLLWPLAVWLVWRPMPRQRLIFAVIVLAVAAAISVVGPMVVKAAGLPIPGNEFDAKGVIQRLRFVAFTDWNRFAFLAVPTGLVPALFLFSWRKQDHLARALTLLTVIFFGFFYLQGYRVLLHHFIPAMIPPLVIMWRSDLMQNTVMRVAVTLGLVASLWIAWPRDMGMHAHDRAFAAFIQTEGPRFASSEPADGERFRGFDPKALDTFHELFGRLLPIGYGDHEPGERFYGAPLVWWFYSEYPKAADQQINYVLKPLADATAADGTLFDSYDGYGLFIRDMALFETQKSQKLPYDTGAPLLATPRDVLFGLGAKWPQKWSDRTVIDLVAIAKHILGRT